MGSKLKFVTPSLLFIGSVISVWFLAANLQQIQPAPYMFAIFLLGIIYASVALFRKDLLASIKRSMFSMTNRKLFTITALATIALLGFVARLYFFLKFTYVPVSDPVTFYESALKLASGDSLSGNVYVAFHPYLSAYNNLLGLAVRVISNPWLATILLNTVIDVVAAFLAFALARKMLNKQSRLPLFVFGIWFLNPLNIIFSVISIPVIVVNFFIVLTFLVSYVFLQKITEGSAKSSLLFSGVLGLAAGLGNIFRPVFIILVIALALLLLYMFFTTHNTASFLKLSAGCLLVIVLIFAAVQRINLDFVTRQTGLLAAGNPSGWSMYVGSDWNSYGEWRPYQNQELAMICKDALAQKDYDMCHSILRRQALSRHKSYGIYRSSSLFVRKLYHQSEKQNYFYNAEQSIIGYAESRTAKTVNALMVIFMFSVYIFSARFLYNSAKGMISAKHIEPILVLLVLTMIGWFFSMVLMESAPRYSTILYPIFIMFTVMSLGKMRISSKATNTKNH